MKGQRITGSCMRGRFIGSLPCTSGSLAGKWDSAVIELRPRPVGARHQTHTVQTSEIL